jgi:hypothetical protein
MSCPDWRRLDPDARDAYARPGGVPITAIATGTTAPTAPPAPTAPIAITGWEAALRHLDSGCPRCWQEAIALDPTLIFRRLPVPELGTAQEAEEVEAARLAVTAMRTASRVGRRGLPATSGPWPPWPSLRAFRLHPPRLHAARWALAAGLTAMALVFGSAHAWHAPAGAPPAAASSASLASSSPLPITPTSAELPGGAAAFAGARAAQIPAGAAPDALPASSRSSIEGLSRPRARVYQLDGPHMSVVMIVDDKLDV